MAAGARLTVGEGPRAAARGLPSIVDRPSSIVAASLAGAYFVAISWLAVLQHVTFHTRARDMGIYVQVLWNTAHGRPFASTLLEENTLHVAEHIAPVLAPLSTLYALAPDPRWLLVLQQCCLAAAGLPIFFWARPRLGSLAGLAIQAGFYAMPAMSRVALSEFHPIVMAALPVSLGLVATLDGRARAAFVWLLLALLVEEETAPLVGAAGAYLLLARRRPAGLALGGLAAAWLLSVVLLVMPAFHDRRTLAQEEGGRVGSHFRQVAERPPVALQWLAGDRGAEAATWLLGPPAGLPLLAPHVLGLAVPSFAILFLQDRAGTYAGHWSAAMLPAIWLAAAAGLARLAGVGTARRQAVVAAACLALLAAGGLSYWRYSLFPGGRGFDIEHFVWTEHELDLAEAVSKVPAAARLDATRRVVPHLAHRPDVYQFPSTFYSAPMRPDLERIDAFVLDLTDSPTRRALDPTDQDTVITGRPRLHTWTFGEGVILLTRERPVPSREARAQFADALGLVGYDLAMRYGTLRVGLHWEARGRLGDWTRVAELVGLDGHPAGRDARVPLEAYLPPSDWDRGQVVVDSVTFRPAPGRYRLLLSWLDEQGRPIPATPESPSLELEAR